MRQRCRMFAWCSITWLVLANGLPAHAGWPGSSHEEKKGDKPPDASGKKIINQELAKLCIKESAWIAYFKSADGTLAPVRSTLSFDHDEDWLGLRFTDYEGPRIRLGVLSVFNKAAEPDSKDGKERLVLPAAGIQEMLTAALYSTNRFDVIEQQRIDEIKRQQTREDTERLPPALDQGPGRASGKASGKAAGKEPAKEPVASARVLGVQYLVYATVNEWTPDRFTDSAGSMLNKIPVIGSLGQPSAGKTTAEVAITFTLADVESGQVLFTTSLRARMSESHFGLGGNEGSESASKVPVNYAVAACTNKAAFEIAQYLKNRRWKGSVVAVNGADYYVNTGSQGGMKPGTVLRVDAVLMKVVDQETHTILGEDTREIGALKVYKVDESFSVGRVYQSSSGPATPLASARIRLNDRVELDEPPPQPRAECVAAEARPAPWSFAASF
jgi:curli biogenesis system outer membrane secretion channel CsgG